MTVKFGGEYNISLNRLKNNHSYFAEKPDNGFKISCYSFSNLCKNPTPLDIYTGNESIPFEKRDSLFKSILRKEFSDAIKDFENTIRELKKD